MQLKLLSSFCGNNFELKLLKFDMIWAQSENVLISRQLKLSVHYNLKHKITQVSK